MTYKEAFIEFLKEFGKDLARFDPDKAVRFNKKLDGYTGAFLQDFIGKASEEHNFPISRWYLTYKLSDLYGKYPTDDSVSDLVANFALYTGSVSMKKAAKEYERLLKLHTSLDRLELAKIDKYLKA